MKLGYIGLGKMGKNMVERMLEKGHEVVVYNRSPEPVQEMQAKGAIGATSLSELVEKLSPPRLIWVMVSAGAVDKITIDDGALIDLIEKQDLVIDGGNSFFKDTLKRAKMFEEKGREFMDVGVSGGPSGARNGACLMIGGRKETYQKLEPLFADLSTEEGYLYIGEVGSGHFVKMVHNAVEYGMMQAIGEGFDLIKNGPFQDLDLKNIAHNWNHGSVVRSFLIELLERAFEKEKDLSSIADYVEDSGEGRWSVITAIDHDVPFSVNSLALYERFASRTKESFARKVLAALRHEFGGHAVKEKK